MKTPILSGYVRGRAVCPLLLQRSDNLRLRMPALAHTLSSIRNHTSGCVDLGEQVTRFPLWLSMPLAFGSELGILIGSVSLTEEQ